MHVDTVARNAAAADVIRSQGLRLGSNDDVTEHRGSTTIMSDNLASLFEVLAASIAGGVFAVLLIVLG